MLRVSGEDEATWSEFLGIHLGPCGLGGVSESSWGPGRRVQGTLQEPKRAGENEGVGNSVESLKTPVWMHANKHLTLCLEQL